MISGVLITLFACSGAPVNGVSMAERLTAIPAAIAIPAAEDAPLLVQLTVRAGSAYDPPGQEGLAAVTAQSLLEGGSTTQALTELGVEPGLGPLSPELVRFTARVPPEHIEAFIPLFAELFTHFQPSAQLLERLSEQAKAPALAYGPTLASLALDLWINEGHPYGHAPRGRSASISTLTEQDLRRFFDRRYVRSAFTVGVTGDPIHAHALAEALGTLPAGKSESPTPAPRPVAHEVLLLSVPDPGAAQPTILLGQPIALRAGDPRMSALALGLRALGAQLAPSAETPDEAPLIPELQWDRIQPHAVLALPPVAPDAVYQAVRDALARLDRALSVGLEEQALSAPLQQLHAAAQRRSTLPGLRLDAALMARALSVLDPLSALPEALDALHVEDVNAALQAALKPGVWRVVVVGPDLSALRFDPGEERPAASVYESEQASPAGPARLLTISPEELTR